jgi:Protein of unknown function (DUF2442)
MSSLVKPVDLKFDRDSFWVSLSDGRVIGVPLAWFPRLMNATDQERKKFKISSRGLHWESLDEDILVSALLDGKGDLTRRGRNHHAA